MDPRLGTLERGTELELYRLLRRLERNPAELTDELLLAVTRFALERLWWLHAMWSGRELDRSPFPPGGEANWMDVRGWAMMALNVLSAIEPSLGRFPLNIPDPLIETHFRWAGDLTAEDFDRAPGARGVVEEAIQRLSTAAIPIISTAAKETQMAIRQDA